MEKSIFQIPFKVISKLIYFKKSQKWSRDQLDQYQDYHLKKLVIHAADHVPYYKNIFAETGFDPHSFRGRIDMDKLPILDKEIIRQNATDLLADNAKNFGITWDSTSGSSGTPLHFALSNDIQAAKIAALLRSYGWAGYKPGKRMFSLQSYYFKNHDYKINRLYNILRFDSNRLNKRSALSVMKKLLEFKPEFFMGFPFDIMMMGEICREAGTEIYSPKSIITYGETLSDYRRQKLEGLFQCRVFNFYSLHECSAMISQCENGNLHLIEDFAYHELLPENNKYSLLGTSYFNYAMPLLRYKIRDYVVPAEPEQSCACGRNFRIIKEIEGKACDYLQTPDGRFLGSVMSHSIDRANGVICSQCVQHSINEIDINLIVDDDFDKNSQIELDLGLRKRLGSKIQLTINIVDELEKRDSGKTPFIISRIGNKFR